jgi:sugar lactone lactonase YvrE
MTEERAFEQTIQGWLEAGPMQAPDQVVESILLTVMTTPQERGRWVPWRIPHMTGFLRAMAVAALAAAVISVPIIVNHTTQPASVAPPPLPPTACPGGAPLASGSIATIAGNGLAGYSGDGGKATVAMIQTWDRRTGFSGDLIVGPGGDLFFTDPVGQAVRRVATDGTITTLAGPATGAPFVEPGGLAFDAQGDLYVADPGASRIWKLGPDGAITSAAGTGVAGSSGNGGKATDAEITAGRLDIGPAGDLYIDDMYGARMIDTAGVIHAFAGTGVAGFSGDGGQATDAMFGDSAAPAAVASDGTVYMADPGNQRIRKVDPSGRVTTIVGTSAGRSLTGEEGGPATEATLTESPYAIALSGDGDLYFTEWQRNSVRVVDSNGTIATVAGNALGAGGFDGDCGPAGASLLTSPQGIAYRDGALFVVDGDDNRIRMVVP